MDYQRAIEIIETEIECVNSDCDRDCANCSLVMPKDDIIAAYNEAILALAQMDFEERNLP